ncbi:MAG: hypothetical protein KAU90_06670, partial [Sulfurovaceae bacterium]|nr:hypothetical protein [Sulfurovaceae bacterium]
YFLQEELGIKFAYQAKQIAPSLFEEYLDEQKEYQYYVYKCDNYWCFFAYDIEEITSFLETKGLKKHQIGKIFFVQELAEYIEKAISLGNNTALKSIDGTATILPKRLLEGEYNYQELDIDKISLHNGIAISSSYSSLIPLKQTILVTSLLVILGGIFIAEGMETRNSIQSDREKLELLLDKNPKLSSNRIRKSILQQYEPIDKRERRKRDIIDNISKLLSSQSQLKELIVDDKKVVATIETTNDRILNQVLRNAHSKKLIAKKQSAKQIRVEGVL